MHGHTGGINLTQVGQHFTNILVTRTADRARDHDDLTAQHLPLDDFPDTTGFTSGNTDTMHICAGFPTGSRQGIGIHVKHLPQARFAVDIDQLRPHRQHRHTRSWIHQHFRPANGGQQTNVRRSQHRTGGHGDIARLNIIPGAADKRAAANRSGRHDSLLPTVAPLQGKHGVGKRGKWCACVNADGLFRLQTERLLRTRWNLPNHGQGLLWSGGVLPATPFLSVPVVARGITIAFSTTALLVM